MNRKFSSAVLIIFLSAFFVYADSVTISEIDNSSLLVNQKIKTSINVTDNNGKPILELTRDNFRIFETPEGCVEEEKEIIDFEAGKNMNSGINLLFLVDNSGSMYANDDGSIEDSPDESIWRITHAKNALLSLIKEIKNPKDRTGVVTFNYKTGNIEEPTNKLINIEKALNEISKPEKGEGYTELYECLYESVDIIKNYGGRKIIVLLSDGENFPLENNSVFTERVGIDGAIESARKEGISVFTIGFGREADAESLRKISAGTGGLFFWASNQNDLEKLYSLIREQVLNEYYISYRAGMEAADKKQVRVLYDTGGSTFESRSFYYSDTMFGLPQDKINYLFFILIPIALLLLWLLSLLKFEKKKSGPSLDVLTMNGKKAKMPAMTIVEGRDEIKIGSAKNSDMTIVGDAKISGHEASIKKKNGRYTIMSDSPTGVIVNNRRVKSKGLRSGDLITIGNTTIVFDSGEAAVKTEKKK